MTNKMPNSYWAATATAAPKCPALDCEITADICIVGGGFLGLSAALNLAEKGRKVVLLEASQPGWGASGRNGGQIIPGVKAERSILVEQLGEEQGGRLFEWAGQAVEETLALINRYGINCNASQPGWLQPAHSDKILETNRQRVEEWNELGIKTRLLSKQETADRLGTNWYHGAYFDPRGGRLHPLSYAYGLARAAQNTGVRIFGNSKANKAIAAKNGWTVWTDFGAVKTEQMLVCTNAYTDSGTSLVPRLEKTIISLPSYMIATAPLSNEQRKTILPAGETAADLRELMNHFRLEQDGRFIIGGRGDLSETDQPQSFRHITAKLGEIFPQLANQPIDFRWSGRVAITIDGLPHIHNPARGLWTAIGCNGRGVGYCTLAGGLMGELMTGGDAIQSPIPVSTMKQIPFHRFHTIGARFVIFWKSWQDKYQ